MGRLILLLCLVLAAYIVWRAFGPHTWNRNLNHTSQPARKIKGPDDDENFLWELEKKQFKQRRAQEEAYRQEEERIKRAQQRYDHKPKDGDDPKPTEEPPASES